MNGDKLYKTSWEIAFAEFVSSIEEYIELELPADASPAERKLQKDFGYGMANYKQAKGSERREEMIETFTIPLQLLRHVDWNKMMGEYLLGGTRKLTITEVREGHGEELVSYEVKVERGY